MSILQKVDLLYETSKNEIIAQQNESYFQKLKDDLQKKNIKLDDIETEITLFASNIALLYCKAGIRYGSQLFADGYFTEE